MPPGFRLRRRSGTGGSLPNADFTDVLGLPTRRLPHSCPGCLQHAPDEHLLAPIAREGLVPPTRP
ncbi:hypothetical protein [Streptomyces sp. AC550_RSS872]|uniref:hypothetical protein n=1 Tax=Streptomyces sp. AC550_RSS872 TaxID=2823689 RepID=UPI0020B7EEB4|nr:hypothetical protein [Streptomyces sp. AC550_RSS872]